MNIESMKIAYLNWYIPNQHIKMSYLNSSSSADYACLAQMFVLQCNSVPRKGHQNHIGVTLIPALCYTGDFGTRLHLSPRPGCRAFSSTALIRPPLRRSISSRKLSGDNGVPLKKPAAPYNPTTLARLDVQLFLLSLGENSRNH